VAVLTKENFIIITDSLAAAMLLAKGDSSGGVGDNDVAIVDDTGARGRLGDLEVELLNLEDGDYASAIATIRQSIDKAGYQSYIERAFDKAIDALETLCADAGITGVASIKTFAKYYNTGAGGPWLALLSPYFRTLVNLAGGVTLDAVSVYAPTGALASRAIASSVLGSLTDTAAVDETLYAGAARAQAVITDLAFAEGITSSSIIVTGRGRKVDGTLADGLTWTGTITANATVTLAPALANSLLVDVTNIAFGAGIEDVTAVVNAAAPASRTDPPT
jgi:hypothetical protein